MDTPFCNNAQKGILQFYYFCQTYETMRKSACINFGRVIL